MAVDISLPDGGDALLTALIVAALFAGGAWIIPSGYYTMADTDRFVSVERMDVKAINNTEHQLNVTYESQDEYPVKAEISLHRLGRNDSADVVVQQWERSGFLPEGKQTVTLELVLEEAPEPGTYYYVVEVEFHPGYNVERRFTERSNSFPLNKTESDGSWNPPD